MMKRLLIIVALISLLIGCVKPKPPPEYSVIPAFPTASKPPASKSNAIRMQAIRDTALSVGAQGGLSRRAHEIDAMLVRDQIYLDRAFNFNQLVLKHNVLPPVLTEGETTLNLANDRAIRLADTVYKIVKPPRFVTAAPTWREYLWLNYQNPETPNSTLLPTNDEERQAWNTGIKAGWKAGVAQANQIFSINLGRLKRDYNGMVLYRELLAQNMVTPPYVAKLNLGVTGGGNYMRINDQVLRITAISQLNPNSRKWKPIVRKGQTGGADTDWDIANP